METADVLTMILFGLIVVVCWISVPGLISGWLFRESGRAFGWGFAIGAVCGPAGVLISFAYVYFASRNGAMSSLARRRSGTREHYVVPVFGRVHASTAWMLAGLATFMCTWLLGGIGYEVFYNLPRGVELRRAAGLAKATPQPATSPATTSSTLAAANTTAFTKNDQQPPRAPLLAAVTSQPATGTSVPGAAPAAALSEPPISLEGLELTGNAPQRAQHPAPQQSSTPQSATVTAPTPRPVAHGRDAIISELTGSLGARGYKAHATITGDTQTSTLSISCATLTRAAGNQLLGSGRTRQALKAAGIRIVVMINGQESWTYML